MAGGFIKERDKDLFTVRLRVGESHRVQMNVGDAAVILRELRPGEENAQRGVGCYVIVRIEDADAHCQRARANGATVLHEPVTHVYGERQYSARDFEGYLWDFTQTVADIHPDDWGGKVELL